MTKKQFQQFAFRPRVASDRLLKHILASYTYYACRQFMTNLVMNIFNSPNSGSKIQANKQKIIN